MIQDIEPHCYHNEYQNRKAKAGDIALCYRDRETLILEGEQLAFPTLAQLEDSLEDIYERAVYLFAIDGHYYYMVPEIQKEPEGMRWVRLSYFRTARPGTWIRPSRRSPDTSSTTGTATGDSAAAVGRP